MSKSRIIGIAILAVALAIAGFFIIQPFAKHKQTVEPSGLVVNKPSIRPPDAFTPAAGICSEPEGLNIANLD